MKNIKKVVVIFFFYFTINYCIAEEIKIKLKIEDEIITNQDIQEEAKFIALINTQLRNIPKEELLQISIKSIIQEKIKFLELEKYFNFSEKNEKVEKLVEENLYKQLKVSNTNDLNQIILKNDLNIESIKKKYKINIYWNKLIYDKYIGNVTYDINQLKSQLKKNLSKNLVLEYYLVEILFELEDSKDLNEKYFQILETINVEGFDFAANKYSKSNTAINNGVIGWVKETQISKKIVKKLSLLNKGELSKPIQMGNGFLIVKYNDKREIQAKIDFDKELKTLEETEINRQLSLFATNYFNKIKKNFYIDEL